MDMNSSIVDLDGLGLRRRYGSDAEDMVNGELITNIGSGQKRRVPVGVTSINIEGWGKGGNGGSSLNSGTITGSGGGGGGYFAFNNVSVTPGQDISFSISLLQTTCLTGISNSGDQGYEINQQGSPLSIPSIGTAALAALSSSRVAYIDASNDQLRTYDFNGSTWSQVGTGLSITSAGTPALAALSSNRVAFFDDANDQLRTYDFNGSTWSQVGTGLTITGAFVPKLASLSSNRVAFFDRSNALLLTYDFDGTNWSQVGTGLNFAFPGIEALAALSSNRVALMNGSNDQLRTYDFNGSTWSQVGTGLSITSAGTPALAALSSNRVAYIDDTNEQLISYNIFTGLGGTASGGDTNANGNNGIIVSSTTGNSGAGGNSPNGGSGGAGVPSGTPGNNGAEPGGGGGGAGIGSTPGNGANGGIKFSWIEEMLIEGFEAVPFSSMLTWVDAVGAGSYSRETDHVTQGTYSWRATGTFTSGDVGMGIISGSLVGTSIIDLSPYNELKLDLTSVDLPSLTSIILQIISSDASQFLEVHTDPAFTGSTTLSINLNLATFSLNDVTIVIGTTSVGASGLIDYYFDNLRAIE